VSNFNVRVIFRYWMFDDPTALRSKETEHDVYKLPLNHAPVDRPKPVEVPDELECPVCCDLFYEPVTICKGEHTFCRACLSREIDARKCCPLDRNPITSADPVPATQIQASLDALLAAAF